MKKKKILFLIFELGHGGAEKVLVNLVNNLSPEKYEITVFTIYNYGVNLGNLLPHIRHKYLFDCKPIRGLNVLLRMFSPGYLYRRVVKEHYDVEIAYLEGLPTRIIGCSPRAGVRKFAWVHGEVYDTFFRAFRSRKEACSCYNNFNSVTFVSESARDIFFKTTGWQLKSRVIYNVLEIDRILSLAKEPIEQELDGDKINMCCVGKLDAGKGCDRLIKVISRLKIAGKTNWHLYFLGEGNLRNKLEKMVVDGHLSANVTFLGYQTNPYKYVSKMNLLVCPSYREAFSTAVSEAVVVNTPFLTTDCSGMKEILGDSNAGVIVENSENGLYNGLSQICDNPGCLEKMREDAVSRAVSFSTDQRIRQFENYIFHDR